MCKRVKGASCLRNADSSLELRQVGSWTAQKKKSETNNGTYLNRNVCEVQQKAFGWWFCGLSLCLLDAPFGN